MGEIRKRKYRDRKTGEVRECSTWTIRYYRNGKRYEENTGSTKEGDAKRLLKLREGDIAKGVPVTPKIGRLTFDDAAVDVVTDYRINKRRTLAHVERRLKLHLSPHFSGWRMAAITTADVASFARKRLDAGASNAEVNRELAVLKRAFTLAIRAGLLLQRPHIQMLTEDNTRRGFFEPGQFESVRAHLPAALRPVVEFAYRTGWRVKSEVLPLEWRQVDFPGRVVRLDPGTTKNKDGRSFPFTAALEALLRDRLAEHDRLKAQGRIVPLVFHRNGSRIRDFRGAWKTACMKAGVPGGILHDFRRTAVRNLERAGVPRSSAMAMVGHKTEAIYRRYAIVDAGALRDAAARIDQLARGIGETGAAQGQPGADDAPGAPARDRRS